MPTPLPLQRFVDDELARAPTLIAQTLDGLLDRLRNSAERELSAGLQQRASIYRSAFCESLRERVQAELARADGGSGMAPPSGLGGLALMDETRVDIDIEISRATQTIDAQAEWELRELQTFTSTLIGQAHVSAESNPLRPTLYAAALWDAGCAVFSHQGQQTALLRLATPGFAGLLKNAWAAASSRLERQGVSPGMFRTVVLPPGSATARHPPPVAAGAAVPGGMRGLLSAMSGGGERRLRAGDDLRGSGVPSLASGTASLLAADAAASSRAGAAPSAPDPKAAFELALSQLDELLRHMPAQAVSLSGEATSAARLQSQRNALVSLVKATDERQMIELLGRIFDAVSVDRHLHPAFVAPVAHLQTAAFRAAMRDPSTLDSTQHPLWQLLDRIGEASASYPAAGDPRAGALASLCRRLAEELSRSTAPDAALFRKALAKLDDFLAAQLQAQLRAAARSVDELRRAEQLQLLQDQLVQRLVEQMQPLRPSAGVRRFVISTWSRVLATAMLQAGEQSPSFKGYVALVDDLLWSVQSPDHPASRQRLTALLPSLLQRLRDGMALIALAESEQQAILDELMTIHTAALRLAGPGSPAEPTAQQIVQKIRDETGPAISGAALAGDRLIDWSSLETVPADLLPPPAAASADPKASPEQTVSALSPPQRRRMFVNGRWARVQLLWRSDRGGFYLFAGEIAGQTHSITRNALERLAGVDLLAPLETRSLVQRALDSVSRMAAPAAVSAPPAPTRGH